MSGDEISEDLIKIKTFREYLDHIVNQIESEKYEVDRVKKLSELITDVFNEVNDDISDDSDLEVISTAAISDSESASSENTIDNNLFLNDKTKSDTENIDVHKDKYVEEFTNDDIDNSDLIIYDKCPETLEVFKNFMRTSLVY
tara:strand:+ start:187 stop:615 length:429 start_codon:yes stop_codon:yes gene_type:complete